MRIIPIAVLVLCAGVSASATGVAAAEPADVDCPGGVFADLGQVDCYTLVVPKRHDADDPGGEIRLFVSILRASGPDPEPDPIVFLAGGPGAAALPSAPELAESRPRRRG